MTSTVVTASAPRPRGRYQFDRFEPALNIVTMVLARLPRAMRLGLWAVADLLHGSLGTALRFCLARTLAKSCGRCVMIGPYVAIIGWEQLVLGDHVSIHRGCYLDASKGIRVGSNVSIAHQTSLISTNHTWADESLPIRDNAVTGTAIHVDDDVWIGCGCRVLAGVAIGSRTVVAAGAVVTASASGRVVLGGVPARVIRSTLPS